MKEPVFYETIIEEEKCRNKKNDWKGQREKHTQAFKSRMFYWGKETGWNIIFNKEQTWHLV